MRRSGGNAPTTSQISARKASGAGMSMCSCSNPPVRRFQLSRAMIVAAVDGDAQQPRLQVFVALEGGRVLQQAHEHVLVHVLRVARDLVWPSASRYTASPQSAMARAMKPPCDPAARRSLRSSIHPPYPSIRVEGAIVSTISEFAESTREPRRDGSAGRASRSSGGLRKARNGKGIRKCSKAACRTRPCGCERRSQMLWKRLLHAHDDVGGLHDGERGSTLGETQILDGLVRDGAMMRAPSGVSMVT